MPVLQMSAVYLPLLLSAAAFLIVVFSFFHFKSYLRARTGHERILAELREEVNKILRSIDETTDRDISLIEEKERNLKGLLEDIEKRFKIYVRETENRRNADTAYAVLQGKNSPGTVSPRQSPVQDAGAYAELGKNRYRAEKALPEPAAAFPLPQFSVKSETAPASPLAAAPAGGQIASLLKAGLSAAVIASRLGISIAEVEFAAALLERRDTL